MGDCIDWFDGDCKGPVERRAVPGGTAVDRCEYHFDLRLARYEESLERCANSDVAPSWFDPLYAGESWDGE